MNKKKYRVYKAGGQQNPTAMWFAQMGAEQPSQEEMMMMQEQQAMQQQEQDPMEMLTMKIEQAMSQGMDSEKIIVDLIKGNVPVDIIERAFLSLGLAEDIEKLPAIVEALGEEATEEQSMQEPPMSKAQYVKEGMKQARMGMEQEGNMKSETNVASEVNAERDALIKFTGDNTTKLALQKEYDEIFNNKMLVGGQPNTYEESSAPTYTVTGDIEPYESSRMSSRSLLSPNFNAQDIENRIGETARSMPSYGDAQLIKDTNKETYNILTSQRRGGTRRLSDRRVARIADKGSDMYDRSDRRALRRGLRAGDFTAADVLAGENVLGKAGYPQIQFPEAMSAPMAAPQAARTLEQMRADARAAGAYEDVTPVMMPEEEMANAGVTDDMSFSQAFGMANKALGEDGTFMWRGKKYGTRRGSSSSSSSSSNDADETIEDVADVTYEADLSPGDKTTTVVPESTDPWFQGEGRSDLDPDTWLAQVKASTDIPNDVLNEQVRYLQYLSDVGKDLPTSAAWKKSLDIFDGSGASSRVKFNPSWTKTYEYGGMYSDDGLEMARFGRGRERRQARRAARQARRAGRQANRAIRNLYGDIAFPAGYSPMLAGMPMMGPMGAGLDMMQFYGKRGPLGGLREFSMNMPMNVSRGMFMNGMFNPLGMQGMNNTAFQISYPGSSTGDVETQQAAADIANDEINEGTPGTPGAGGSKSKDDTKPEEDKTSDSEAPDTEDGDTGNEGNFDKDCGEGAVKTAEGNCVCMEGYTRDTSFTGEGIKCIQEGGGVIDEVEVEGELWVKIAAATGAGVGAYQAGKWIKKKTWDKFRSRTPKKSTTQALMDLSESNLKGAFADASQTSRFDALSKESKAKFNQLGKTAAQEALEGTGPRFGNITGQALSEVPVAKVPGQVTGNIGTNLKPNVTTPGSATKPLLTEAQALKSVGVDLPKKLSNTQRALLRGQVDKIMDGSAAAARALAKKYGVKVAANASRKSVQAALRNALRFLQEGGFADSSDQFYGNSDLYKFTGGGQEIDYFADGGYYEDVYDPYMPMADNGTIVDRPYQTAEEYGDQYTYPGPYLEPMITDSIRESIINSGRLLDGVTGEEIEKRTVMSRPDFNTAEYLEQLNNYRAPAQSLAARISQANKEMAAKRDIPTRNQYGGYQEGDVVDMTEAQLGAFLMAGGQVEFVD